MNMYPRVEPSPRRLRPKFDGVPNEGRRRCHDSHFRRPRVDFSVWMRWNGPLLSSALRLSPWWPGWCSSDGLPRASIAAQLSRMKSWLPLAMSFVVLFVVLAAMVAIVANADVQLSTAADLF
jgi:hypothetical protein